MLNRIGEIFFVILITQLFFSCGENTTVEKAPEVQPQGLGNDITLNRSISPTISVESKGDRTGSGGGDGLVCYENGEISSVHLWDFIEATSEKKYDPYLGEKELEVHKKVNLVLKRILQKQFGELGHDVFGIGNVHARDHELFEWFSNLDINKIDDQEVIDIIDFSTEGLSIGLANVNDTNSIVNIENYDNCKFVQLAIQESSKKTDRSLIKIDKRYWDHMDNDTKAGLLIHEMFLLYLKMFNPESVALDTENARYLTTAFATSMYKKMEGQEFDNYTFFLDILASVGIINKFRVSPIYYDYTETGISQEKSLSSYGYYEKNNNGTEKTPIAPEINIGEQYIYPIKFNFINGYDTNPSSPEEELIIFASSYVGSDYVRGALYKNAEVRYPYAEGIDKIKLLALPYRFDYALLFLGLSDSSSCGFVSFSNLGDYRLETGWLEEDTIFILKNGQKVPAVGRTPFEIHPYLSGELYKAVIKGKLEVKTKSNSTQIVGEEDQYTTISFDKDGFFESDSIYHDKCITLGPDNERVNQAIEERRLRSKAQQNLILENLE